MLKKAQEAAKLKKKSSLSDIDDSNENNDVEIDEHELQMDDNEDPESFSNTYFAFKDELLKQKVNIYFKKN